MICMIYHFSIEGAPGLILTGVWQNLNSAECPLHNFPPFLGLKRLSHTTTTLLDNYVMYNHGGLMKVVVNFSFILNWNSSDCYYYHCHCHFHYDDDDDDCCCYCYHLSKANLLWVITIPLSCYQSPAARMWTVAPFSPRSVTAVHSLRPLAAKRDTLSATTPLENGYTNFIKYLINPLLSIIIMTATLSFPSG